MWEFVLLVPILLIIYNWWRRRSWIGGLHKKAVLITGCDTGFGNATAKSLYARGIHVYAGCYTKSGAERLREETGDKLRTILMDVTSTDSVHQAYSYVTQTLPVGIEFWGIVNNAGILGQMGPLEFLTKEDFKEVFNVNLYGMIDVTNTFLPLLKASKGRIVNTCSIAGQMATPELYPYAISKWAVKGFSETLRLEKSKWGIKVSTIAPAGFGTNIVDVKPYADRYQKRWMQLSPELREEYGDDYMDKSIARYKRLSKTMINQDLNPVIKAYEDALFNVNPRHIYYPDAELLSLMPTKVLTKFFDMNSIIPQALQKQ